MGKLKILIVDDIYSNRLLLGELISILGHESVQAENGQEAIKCLEGDSFDLVLMDIEMPVMNGLETTTYIRNEMVYPKNIVTIAALTAHNPELFMNDFNAAGFDDLLTKPYSIEKIKNLIKNLC